MSFHMHAAPMALALLLGLVCTACRAREEAGPAPVDTGDTTAQQDRGDTVVVPTRPDTIAMPPDTGGAGPDTSVATPPINPAPPPTRGDSAPPEEAQPTGPQPAQAPDVELRRLEYEGWRQYSVNCARCHGQDVLPNPVAANLLISVAPGGPMESYERFAQVVGEGRPERGMPAFKSILSSEQIRAIHAYVKGRAEKRIPPGRPKSPGA